MMGAVSWAVLSRGAPKAARRKKIRFIGKAMFYIKAAKERIEASSGPIERLCLLLEFRAEKDLLESDEDRSGPLSVSAGEVGPSAFGLNAEDSSFGPIFAESPE